MVSSRIFRSRWAALLWAAGIVWTAYDVATSVPHDAPASGNRAAPAAGATDGATATDATDMAVDPADLAALANAGD